MTHPADLSPLRVVWVQSMTTTVVGQVLHVSLETVKIVEDLPKEYSPG